MRRPLLVATCLVAMFVAAPAPAIEPDLRSMEALRDRAKADKRQVVRENLDLTEAEAKLFWPVYDDFQQRLGPLYDRAAKAIGDYARASTGELTDAQALTLMDEALAVEEAEASLRKVTLGHLLKLLPAKKVVRYFQLETKIRAVHRFDLAIAIPLAH